MPAGKHGSSEITITYDDAPSGVGQNVTQHILTMNGIKIEAITQPSHAFGDAWEEHTPTGMKRVPPITFTGYYDDTAATGPHIVFVAPDDDPQDGTRTLVIVFGNAKTFTTETRLVSYEVLGKNSGLTEFAAVVQPTGSATWS